MTSIQRKYPANAILLIMLLAQLSCSDLGDFVTPADTPVQITVHEVHTEYAAQADPTIVLDMQTLEIYPCCNYSIVADFKTRPGTVEATVLGIYKPDICLTAFGPARFRQPLSLAPGSYSLIVRNGSGMDRHQLLVTESAILVGVGTSSVSMIPNPLAWRFPRQSFAFVCGTTVETAWMGDAFRDSLLMIPRVSQFFFPDSGETPYPRAASGHWHNDATRFFRYASESDYDSAGARLKRFSVGVIGNKQGITMYLINWRNVQYMSWKFNQASVAGDILPSPNGRGDTKSE